MLKFKSVEEYFLKKIYRKKIINTTRKFLFFSLYYMMKRELFFLDVYLYEACFL